MLSRRQLLNTTSVACAVCQRRIAQELAASSQAAQLPLSGNVRGAGPAPCTLQRAQLLAPAAAAWVFVRSQTRKRVRSRAQEGSRAREHSQFSLPQSLRSRWAGLRVVGCARSLLRPCSRAQAVQNTVAACFRQQGSLLCGPGPVRQPSGGSSASGSRRSPLVRFTCSCSLSPPLTCSAG